MAAKSAREDLFQRLRARPCGHDVGAETFEHHFQCQQVGGLVVDDEDVDFVHGRHELLLP
jgi:hypothetical protein